MRKLLFIAAFVSVTVISSAATTPSKMGNENFVIITLANNVPAEVMREFEASFVYADDGFLRGARIDMLRPYLSSAEIVDLVKTYTAGMSVLYEGYKPKGPRGCKANNNWLCVIRDVDAIH